jgi:uncharacterized protein YdaU (DUF1376 family)
VNYWPRWVNAIKKRTATLSLMEMGAYDRLLDHYYSEEQPLPADLDECCRIAAALTKDERKAVEKVLARFFVLGSAGFHNERADEEILLALPKIAAAKANGSKGGRPRGSPNKPGGFPLGKPDETSGEPTPKAPQKQRHTPHTEGSDCVTGTHAGDPPPFDPEDGEVYVQSIVHGAEPTRYGAITKSLRLAGIGNAQPGLMRFRLLVDAGADAGEFLAFVPKALGVQGDRFAYIVGAVEGERKRATATLGQLHRGAMPNRQEAIEQRNNAVGDAWLAEQGAA